MPSGSDAVDLEVARLLTYLRAPSAVAKTLALMARDEPTPLPPWGGIGSVACAESRPRIGGQAQPVAMEA